MPHVIDSLVVELGLDASKLNSQQRAAFEKIRKWGEEVKREHAGVEDSTLNLGEAFASLKDKALGMLGAIAGTSSLIELVGRTTEAGAAVDRLSRAMGVSANELSRWQGAAREFGSTAEAMASSYQQIANVFTAWQVGGPEAPAIMQLFRAINTQAEQLDPTNAKIIDSTKGVTQAYRDLADNLKIIHDLAPNKNLAFYLAGKIPGMDLGMFNMLVRGSAAVDAARNQAGIWTPAEAAQANRLKQSLDTLTVSVDRLSARILAGETSSGLSVLGALASMIDVINKDISSPHRYVGLSKLSSLSWNDWLSAIGQGLEWRGAKPSVARPAFGGFTSQAQKEEFIRAEAKKRGINPDDAMAVARSEGFGSFFGDQGTSFGAFQLHVTPGGRGGAVGDRFKAQTGLDPSDPRNEAATIMFALDWVKSHGWSDFHGAANGAHLSNWAGIDRSSTSRTTTYTTQINGPITINAGANASASDIAEKLRELGLKRQAQANQSSVGGE